MSRHLTLFTLCLFLVLTRLTGLHVHACASVGLGHERSATHYADNGLLLGEDHAADHAADPLAEIEIDPPPASLGKLLLTHAGDLTAPVAAPVSTAMLGWLTARMPRAPPDDLRRAAVLPHVLPPLRGPPVNTLT